MLQLVMIATIYCNLPQKSIDFTYGMIIDDDVPLPPDLHVPLLTLSRQEEIKVWRFVLIAWLGLVNVPGLYVCMFIFVCCAQSVSYVICAATENGDFNSLVAMQDAEYKLAVRWMPLMKCIDLIQVNLYNAAFVACTLVAGFYQAIPVAVWDDDGMPRRDRIVASWRAWQEGQC
jgi:hypothetical protein